MKKILLILCVITITLLIGCTSAVAPISYTLNEPTIATSSGVQISQSKTTWKAAQPYSIIDFSRTGDSIELVLINNDVGARALISVNLQGLTGNGLGQLHGPMANETVNITGLGDCSDSTYSIPASKITITYKDEEGTTKTQIGEIDIVDFC